MNWMLDIRQRLNFRLEDSRLQDSRLINNFT